LRGIGPGPRRPGIKQGGGIETIGVGEPAEAAGSQAGETPVDFVVAAEDFALCEKETDELLADIAEADQGEIVRANRSTSRG
jgi:hypothetical protein